MMKLVYALNINASIEAESTPDSPTLFSTLVTSSAARESPLRCTCGGSLNNKQGKFDIDSENNLLNSISFNKVTNGLAVNSFTASGVVVKEEMEEKPSFLNDLVDDKNLKNDYTSLLQEPTTQANNNVNNNNNNNSQLGHFVNVNPGFQVIHIDIFIIEIGQRASALFRAKLGKSFTFSFLRSKWRSLAPCQVHQAVQ